MENGLKDRIHRLEAERKEDGKLMEIREAEVRDRFEAVEQARKDLEIMWNERVELMAKINSPQQRANDNSQVTDSITQRETLQQQSAELKRR